MGNAGSPWPDLVSYYANHPSMRSAPHQNRHQRRRAAAVNRRFGVVEDKKDDE